MVRIVPKKVTKYANRCIIDKPTLVPGALLPVKISWLLQNNYAMVKYDLIGWLGRSIWYLKPERFEGPDQRKKI